MTYVLHHHVLHCNSWFCVEFGFSHDNTQPNFVQKISLLNNMNQKWSTIILNIIKLMESVWHYTSSFITLNETVKIHRPCSEGERHIEKKIHSYTQRIDLSLQPTGKDGRRANSMLPIWQTMAKWNDCAAAVKVRQSQRLTDNWTHCKETHIHTHTNRKKNNITSNKNTLIRYNRVVKRIFREFLLDFKWNFIEFVYNYDFMVVWKT